MPGKPALGALLPKGPLAPGNVQVADAVDGAGGGPGSQVALGAGVVEGAVASGAGVVEGAVASGALGVTGDIGETVALGPDGVAGGVDGSGDGGMAPSPTSGSGAPCGASIGGAPAGRTIASTCALVSLMR